MLLALIPTSRSMISCNGLLWYFCKSFLLIIILEEPGKEVVIVFDKTSFQGRYKGNSNAIKLVLNNAKTVK